jgi:hypothetical protein
MRHSELRRACDTLIGCMLRWWQSFRKHVSLIAMHVQFVSIFFDGIRIFPGFMRDGCSGRRMVTCETAVVRTSTVAISPLAVSYDTTIWPALSCATLSEEASTDRIQRRYACRDDREVLFETTVKSKSATDEPVLVVEVSYEVKGCLTYEDHIPRSMVLSDDD